MLYNTIYSTLYQIKLYTNIQTLASASDKKCIRVSNLLRNANEFKANLEGYIYVDLRRSRQAPCKENQREQ